VSHFHPNPRGNSTSLKSLQKGRSAYISYSSSSEQEYTINHRVRLPGEAYEPNKTRTNQFENIQKRYISWHVL